MVYSVILPSLMPMPAGSKGACEVREHLQSAVRAGVLTLRPSLHQARAHPLCRGLQAPGSARHQSPLPP